MRYQLAAFAIAGLALTGAVIGSAEANAQGSNKSSGTSTSSTSTPAPAPAPVVSAPTTYYGVPIAGIATGSQKRKSGA